ncbi:zinc finger mynd domain-containing protein 17 [Moniliophthora roreri MCA 2997]|uniref:Zinc finger mynd domain-containing protein 17 n=1 Tax=Moniliophthora roreri (strain MCA 2997) TaxID=1381753 RepID=V2X4U1_MONRO|nr:zinc finger mynd domain-containing protein 17 [Moniliophthora roreri MCA 2997]
MQFTHSLTSHSQADSGEHKALCEAYVALEADAETRKLLLQCVDDRSEYDIDFVSRLCRKIRRVEGDFLSRRLQRPLTDEEQDVVDWQRSCVACGRTDRIIRMELISGGRELEGCPGCGLTFFCCEKHWGVAYRFHKKHFHGEDYEGRSQCRLNQAVFIDIKFLETVWAKGEHSTKQWLPKRSKYIWLPLKTSKAPGWPNLYVEEFFIDFIHDYGLQLSDPRVLAPCLRSAADGLSIPMTVLYALQAFYGSEGSWTRKTKLNIHVLGAGHNITKFVHMFEEIVHRLPQLKTLCVLLCGTTLETGIPVDAVLCPTCSSKECNMSVEIRAGLYHDYAGEQEHRYTKPDMVIAFNNGQDEWREALEFLIDEEIASVITSYSRDEALAATIQLHLAGANLIPELAAHLESGLGPCRNPWASTLLQPEPNNVACYISDNAWFAGGFRGRVRVVGRPDTL